MPPRQPPAAATSTDEPPSPPTDRVVRVLSALAGDAAGSTVTELAEALGLNRATCAAILASLEQWGWVARQGARRYGLGDGLLGITDAVRTRLPVLATADEVLAQLTETTGYRSTLSRVDGEHLTTIAACGDRGRTDPGSGIGTRVPMRPPFGTVIAAWWSPDERRRWMDRSDLTAEDRHQLEGFLDAMRANGFGARRFDAANQPALSTIQDLVGTLGDSKAEVELRGELMRLLRSYSGTVYSYDELRGPGTLGVSYLVAPVFEQQDARYQLELHVLRGAIDREEIRRLVDLLLDAADTLTRSLGAGVNRRPAPALPSG